MLREFSVDVIHPTTSKDTIYSLLANRVIRDPEGLIAQWQDERTKTWQDVLAKEMLERVRKVAKGLMGLGVKSGSMLIIYAATSYEWALVDFACAAIGAVSIPIYETDSPKQAADIVDDVHPSIAFAGDWDHTQTLEQIRLDHTDLKYVFNFEDEGIEAVIGFGSAITDDALDKAIDQVSADDLATIVYTSGSTGKPKGAMLSHRNFVHIVFAGYDVLDDMLYQPSRLMLFLPLAHCFARYIQYVAIGANGVVGYVPSAKHLLSDLRTFKPTYLLGVPRVFEKVYNAASQKAGSGLQGKVFAQAFRHFVRWSKEESEGMRHSALEKIRHAFYMKTVGTSIRSALGPNLKYLACGGAPMNSDLAHFFNGFDGITFIQGYGMTETAAPCVVNFEEANRVGSVGKPGPGIAVKLADDDEVLIKGANVFQGYYKQPELTAEVMTDDDWLHSGDLGKIDDDGFLYITGRKKDIIITAGGKNISPAPLEDVIDTCPVVSHSLVLGDGKPFVSALVTLEEEMVRSWLASQGLDGKAPMSQIAKSEAVRAFVQQYVDQANSTVSRAESVRKFLILDKDYNQEDGTLTPSMKVVRPKVLASYQELVEDEIYAPKPLVKAQAAGVVTPKVKQALGSVSGYIKGSQDEAERNQQESGTAQDPSSTPASNK
ncbi:long-chain fatty acid--CoA ligase [Bifidobacterium aemilianum]|uniref:Acyl-CoA synthetase n=1 Tax=Bifidobacterium aemilianum TaxID=2493120 RepID=A0A366KA40_9BIFI|nr:AMP-dependent synthetase/ligase [Bifidobacterium aemilianum]RBP98018.1 long-chain fatty acid--CoA ligase [Bifidobacterium aemilianum]